jgi:nicotinamidase-related amidase
MATSRDHTVDCAERNPRALLIVDMINALDFDGGEALRPAALAAAARIAWLRRALSAHGVPTIYANDNFGRWRSDFRSVVRDCMRPGGRGRALVERLPPAPDDYFVLKPKHSAFHATPLDLLLRQLGVEELVVTGVAGDGCVLYTAADAHLRDYRVRVPEDCVASESDARNERALTQMRLTLRADTSPSSALVAALEPQEARDAAA